MKTEFTNAEEAVLKHFYDKLVPHFGITANWPTLVLRSKESSLYLRLEEVTTNDYAPRCYMCGEKAPVDSLDDVVVTIKEKLKGAIPFKFEARACYECRCPQ